MHGRVCEAVAMSSAAPFGPPLTQRVQINDSSVQLPLRFRSSNWAVVIFIAGLTALVFSAVLVGPIVRGSSDSGAGATTVERVGLAAAVAIGWLVFLRALRVRLVLDERGITIRNFLRTHRVEWTDVRHVVLVRRVNTSGTGPGRPYAKCYIVAQRPIAASAAVAGYANRAVALKPVIDACHARGVEIYDA